MRYEIFLSHISILAIRGGAQICPKTAFSKKKKSMDFAKRIVRLYQFLTHEKQEFVMAKQLLCSGTSIGANIAEAIYGSSRKDFVAKLQISKKEAAETLYWLDLLSSCDYIPSNLYHSIHTDCRELLLMRTSAIKTSTE